MDPGADAANLWNLYIMQVARAFFRCRTIQLMREITCSGNCDRLVNTTPRVEEALRESGIREGQCLMHPMHFSAPVFINEDEPGCGMITRRFSNGLRCTHR